MKFDPDISTWTEDQLEGQRNETLDTIRDFIEIFGEDDTIMLPTLKDMLNTVQTEMLERGLQLE